MGIDYQGTYVPSNYEDLYQHYIRGDNGQSLAKVLIRGFVRNEPPEVQEDLLHDMYLRMVEKDVLKLYNPAKSNFGGVVYFVARTVCCNFLKKKGHDPITNLKSATLVESPTEEEAMERGVMYLDRMQTESDGPEVLNHALDAERRIGLLKEEIKRKITTKGQARRADQLLRLLDLLLKGYNVKECAEKEGVTFSTIYNWMYLLREYVEGMAELEKAVNGVN